MSGGAVPGIIYSVLTGIPLILPVVLNTTKLLNLCLYIILPIMFIVALECDSDEKETKKQNGKTIAVNISILSVVSVILFFSLGIFPIEPTSIASGSMEPELSIGDMVIVNTLDKSNISVGDVIKFEKNGMYVIHRVADIEEKNGQTVYLTKGDANQNQDTGYVTADDIVGKIIGRIPYVGYITLWLHSVR